MCTTTTLAVTLFNVVRLELMTSCSIDFAKDTGGRASERSAHVSMLGLIKK